MKNPLAIALGLVIKDQRLKYADDREVTEGEAKSIAANEIGVPINSYKSIESGGYISKSLISKIMKSNIFEFNFDNFLLYLSVLDMIGRDLSSGEEYLAQCDSVIRMVENNDLVQIIDKSSKIRWPSDHSTDYMRRKIKESGLFKYICRCLIDSEYIPKKRTKYHPEFATRKDLKYICNTYENVVPQGAKPLSFFEERWKRNQQIATILYKDETKKEKIGYFILYPLSKDFVDSILTGKIFKRGDSADDTTKTFREAHGLWIGMTTANTEYASGIIISEMFEQIKSLINMPNIKMLFTAAESDQGNHLVKKFGFEAIPGSKISILALTEKTLRNLNIDRILSYQ